MAARRSTQASKPRRGLARRRGSVSLAAFPALVKELHAGRQRSLDPREVPAGSTRALWWRCSVAPDHVWQDTPNHRTQGRGCPYCAGKRISVTNSLASVAPHLAAQWHPTKNRPLTPRDVTHGSDRAVWWRCPVARDHVWRASISSRRKAGCPFCSGNRPSKGHNLRAAHPQLAAQWHPTRNGALSPTDVTPGSTRKVWWRCPKVNRHIWQAVIVNRVKGRGCPHCAGQLRGPTHSFGARKPDLARCWDPERNGDRTPFDVACYSRTPVWWRCPKGPDHAWSAAPASRMAAKHRCPFCARRRLSITNSLAALAPAVASEWHPTLNGAWTPAQVTAGASLQAWWRCPRGHVWKTWIGNRTRLGSGCPACFPRERRRVRRRGRTARVWLPSDWS